MITRFNRFAFLPKFCGCCKKYIFFEPYRRAEVDYPDFSIKENICKKCIDRFLPNPFLDKIEPDVKGRLDTIHTKEQGDDKS